MNLSNEAERLQLVLELQEVLAKEFDIDSFNVFCFGSFLSSDYVDGKAI